mmetsp:Transcript_75211/g.137316  ORF Transcript_75211/g.137316 Transcript_75211/m.137316 type:complete len:210 (+) Transcript_75211:566-1195(+)
MDIDKSCWPTTSTFTGVADERPGRMPEQDAALDIVRGADALHELTAAGPLAAALGDGAAAAAVGRGAVEIRACAPRSAAFCSAMVTICSSACLDSSLFAGLAWSPARRRRSAETASLRNESTMPAQVPMARTHSSSACRNAKTFWCSKDHWASRPSGRTVCRMRGLGLETAGPEKAPMPAASASIAGAVQGIEGHVASNPHPGVGAATW